MLMISNDDDFDADEFNCEEFNAVKFNADVFNTKKDRYGRISILTCSILKSSMLTICNVDEFQC